MDDIKVICRHAKDDFEALQIAQGMEDGGAHVFSVVWTGRPSMLAYVVFAKYQTPTTPAIIDEAITKRLYPDD